MRAPILALLATTLLAGCASPGPTQAPTVESEPTRGSGYLAQGDPTVMDDPALAEQRTTMQLYADARLAKQQLESRVQELETKLASADKRAQKAEQGLTEQTRKNQELHDLYQGTLDSCKEHMDQLLKSRIASLRLQQKIVRMEIAETAGGSKE